MHITAVFMFTLLGNCTVVLIYGFPILRLILAMYVYCVSGISLFNDVRLAYYHLIMFNSSCLPSDCSIWTFILLADIPCIDVCVFVCCNGIVGFWFS